LALRQPVAMTAPDRHDVVRSGVRALGLDVGSKTIGVAISDELALAAHPDHVIARAGTAPDVATVVALVRARDVAAVVVGLPYELSGAIGPRAKRVRVFTDALRAALPPGVELHEQDERFTTALAERVLIEADVSRARRKDVIDKQAAAIILQGWLDFRRPRT
jgi:putative Holliday junction resolvase